MNVAIPSSHVDLIKGPYFGIFTTINATGMPQASIVWCSWDGVSVSINTTKERQKGKNILKNPHTSLIIVDPKNSSRWISIQGIIEIETEGAIDHLDKLTKIYTNHDKFYGNIYPEEQQFRETRIICKIIPKKIFLDAIHK